MGAVSVGARAVGALVPLCNASLSMSRQCEQEHRCNIPKSFIDFDNSSESVYLKYAAVVDLDPVNIVSFLWVVVI
jgi:hypothetical protein